MAEADFHRGQVQSAVAHIREVPKPLPLSSDGESGGHWVLRRGQAFVFDLAEVPESFLLVARDFASVDASRTAEGYSLNDRQIGLRQAQVFLGELEVPVSNADYDIITREMLRAGLQEISRQEIAGGLR